MDIAGLIKAIFASGIDQDLERPAALKAGDRLTGRVVEIRPNGLTLMDFGSFRALADIRFQVAAGQRLPLEVVEAHEPLQLRLLEAQSGAFESSGSGVGESAVALQQTVRTLSNVIGELLARVSSQPEAERPPGSVQAALRQLNLFFQQVDLSRDLPQIMARLESLIQDGGVLFEKKLAEAIAAQTESKDAAPGSGSPASQAITRIVKNDLKPNLLIVKDFLDQPKAAELLPDSKTLTDFKTAIDRLIDDLRQQMAGLRRPPDTDPFQVFFHFLPLFEKSRAAGLKVYYARRAKGAGLRHPMVSLLLEMDRLGTIRTDFLLIQNDLSVTFYVQTPEVKQSLEARADEIRSRLESTVDHLALKVVVSEKKIESFQTIRHLKTNDRQVDIMA